VEIWMSVGGSRSRAVRYEIGVPILFRASGQSEWRAGETVNISRTGVLFDAPSPALASLTTVEMIVALEAPTRGGGKTRCTGQVVRIETAVPGSDRVRMAATIDVYEFVRATVAARA
jgi:hypothetical protein